MYLPDMCNMEDKTVELALHTPSRPPKLAPAVDIGDVATSPA